MANPFDRYDAPQGGNPFDRYDAAAQGSSGAGGAPPQAGSSGRQYASDLSRKFAQGFGMGWRDELAGAMKATFGGRGAEGETWSERYQHARDYERQAQERAGQNTGWAGTAAEMAGGLAPALIPGVGAGAATLKGAAGVGAGLGAIQAAGDTREMSEIPGAVLEGGALGAAGGALGYGAGKLINKGIDRMTGPGRLSKTAQGALDEGRQAYQKFEQSGGQMTRQGLDDLAALAEQNLRGANIRPQSNDFTRELDRLRQVGVPLQRSAGPTNVTPTNIQGLRELAGDLAGSPDPGQRRRGWVLKNTIDEYLSKIQPDQVTGITDPSVLSRQLQEANSLYARGSKAKMVEDAMARAERRAATTGSGGNIENTTKQEIGKLLGRRRDWSGEEQRLINAAVNGQDKSHRLARKVGKLAPGGNGLMTALSVGATAANPYMAIPALLGVGAKAYSDATTQKQAQALLASILKAGVPMRPDMFPSLQRYLAMGGARAAGRLPAPVEPKR